MSFTSLDYSELNNSLRAVYKKIHGYEPPRWSKYFEDNKEERLARRRRQEIWRREKGWLFQWLIKKWTVKLRRQTPEPPEPPEDDQWMENSYSQWEIQPITLGLGEFPDLVSSILFEPFTAHLLNSSTDSLYDLGIGSLILYSPDVPYWCDLVTEATHVVIVSSVTFHLHP